MKQVKGFCCVHGVKVWCTRCYIVQRTGWTHTIQEDVHGDDITFSSRLHFCWFYFHKSNVWQLRWPNLDLGSTFLLPKLVKYEADINHIDIHTLLCGIDYQTYIDEAGVVALAKVVQDAGFIEVGQASHVFDLLKFGWVHLLGCIQVHLDFLILKLKKGMQQQKNEDNLVLPQQVYKLCIKQH